MDKNNEVRLKRVFTRGIEVVEAEFIDGAHMVSRRLHFELEDLPRLGRLSADWLIRNHMPL